MRNFIRNILSGKIAPAENHDPAAFFVPKAVYFIAGRQLFPTGRPERRKGRFSAPHSTHYAILRLIQIDAQHGGALAQFFAADGARYPPVQRVFPQKIPAVFAAVVDIVQCFLDSLLHLHIGDRLEQIVLNAKLDGTVGVLKLAVRSQQDTVRIRVQTAHLFDQFQTIHAGHPNIRYQQVNALLLKILQCRLSVRCSQELVHTKFLPTDPNLHHFQNFLLVIYK